MQVDSAKIKYFRSFRIEAAEDPVALTYVSSSLFLLRAVSRDAAWGIN